MFDPQEVNLVLSFYDLGVDPLMNFMIRNADVLDDADVHVYAVSEAPVNIEHDRLTVIVYPKEQEVFSIPKTVNYGIKRVRGDGIIVKTDIDIEFSLALIEQIRSIVKPGYGVIGICANISQPIMNEGSRVRCWPKSNKRRKGRGACFAMAREDWYTLNGYNERIKGWGADDWDMMTRAFKAIKMKESVECPIYHIKHPNRKATKKFPERNKSNAMLSRKMRWSYEEWGEAHEIA